MNFIKNNNLFLNVFDGNLEKIVDNIYMLSLIDKRINIQKTSQ